MRRNLEVNQSKPSVLCSGFIRPFVKEKAPWKALLKPTPNKKTILTYQFHIEIGSHSSHTNDI